MTRKQYAWIENCIYLAFLFSFLAFGYNLVTTKTLPTVNSAIWLGPGKSAKTRRLCLVYKTAFNSAILASPKKNFLPEIIVPVVSEFTG